MLILFIACVCVATWGGTSVVIEVAKHRPHEPIFSLRNRYEVDFYIWSNAAPLSLRRRYIMCLLCVCLGLFCLARLVWVNEHDPNRKSIGLVLPGVFALIIAADLTRKITKHGA